MNDQDQTHSNHTTDQAHRDAGSDDGASFSAEPEFAPELDDRRLTVPWQSRWLRQALMTRGIQILAIAVFVGVILRLAKGSEAVATSPDYTGVLTFATTGNGDPFSPNVIQELDLATGNIGVRFNGLDASRTRNGETAFVSRLAPGFFADHGVVVVDQRGVPGAPVFMCKGFSYTSERSCAVPKLSPDGQRVAFVTGGSGTVCQGNYGMMWGSFVVVANRKGVELARFEGYADPEWLPDGRLLMMGTACRNAGVWAADTELHEPARIDGDQVATPGGAPAVSPDGRTLAFVWNNQLWALGLDGKPELTQLTLLPKSVSAAAWSPDGSALAVLQFDVSMPERSIVLMRPGDQESVVVRALPVYPYGPISWR